METKNKKQIIIIGTEPLAPSRYINSVWGVAEFAQIKFIECGDNDLLATLPKLILMLRKRGASKDALMAACKEYIMGDEEEK